MPCFRSSLRTHSVEGGFSPNGSGSHGLFIASFTTLSITSSACTKHIDSSTRDLSNLNVSLKNLNLYIVTLCVDLRISENRT